MDPRIGPGQTRGKPYVGPEESQVPEANEGADARRVAPWQHRRVRGLRPPGGDTRLDLEPFDRGGAYCDDPSHQAWREGLDPHLSRQADHEEAARSPDGEGEGESRRVGGGGEA